jgi:hypothetical protein
MNLLFCPDHFSLRDLLFHPPFDPNPLYDVAPATLFPRTDTAGHT